MNVVLNLVMFFVCEVNEVMYNMNNWHVRELHVVLQEQHVDLPVFES